MARSLEWARPLDAASRYHAIDYATRSAGFALRRGEASIAVRIARQLLFAEPGSAAHQQLLEDATAARNAAMDTIARASGSADPEQIDQVAISHLALGEISQAASLWLSLARADARRLDAFVSFAWCMARVGNFETAQQIVDHVGRLERHPKIEAVGMMIALAANDHEAALARAKAAFAMSTEASAWLPLGAAFAKAGAATEQALRLGLRLEDMSTTLHLYDIGQAIQSGRNDDAIVASDAVLAAIPDDHWAAMFKIMALTGKGDVMGAVQAQAALAQVTGARLDMLARLMTLLSEMGAHQQVVDLGKVMRERLPGHYSLLLGMAHSASHVADMDLVADIIASLPPPLEIGAKADQSPFVILSLFDEPELQKQVAKRAASALPGPEEPCAVALPSPPAGGPIRVGYLSNDFYNHATMKLLTAALEHVDRSRFEMFAYSYDRTPDNEDRDRLKAVLTGFTDVVGLGDAEIAERSRADGIHVMVDLKGFTGGARASALKHRLAPVQAAWLGFPGTCGIDEVDYVIADPFIVPAGSEADYTEQVVRLPDCYQPNGRDRPVGEPLSREAAGLPPEGVVFASFNQAYKIGAALFATWMDVLAAVPGSSLWLLVKDETIEARLRARAARHGIAPERLVFARPVPHAEHLARYALVDVALDTYPVGSHTTASDALWMGAPLLALTGKSFVSRVSGSILQAAGMSQLIATSMDEYKAKAIALGNDPGTTAALRETLMRTRESVPLFDPARFAAHLGAAYETMVDIWRQGGTPRSFDVAPIDGVADKATLAG